MPVDAGIYANLLRPVKSIADYDADAQAMQGNALAMQMRRQQIDGNSLSMRQGVEAQQRSAMVREAQRKAAEGAGGDELAYVRGMRLSGMPELNEQADKAEKSIGDRRNTDSLIGGRASENAKRDADTENAVVTMWRDMVGNAANPQQAAQMVQAMHADPRIANTPMARVPLDQAMQMLQQTPFDQWKQQFSLGAAKFVEMNKPTYQQQNLGGKVQTLALPGMGGAPTVAASAPITQSADNEASNARMAADAAAGRGVTIRGQNMTDARARDASAGSSSAGEDPTQLALSKKFGKPETGRRWKPDGSLEPIPGGSADRKTNEQQGGKETVDSVVASLRSSYDALNTGGGITSTEKGPVSNLAAATSKSGLGQVVGGAFGSRNQKERDSIAQARPLLLQAIMKATGMSAKQMDSNAELKLYLATATDPKLSLEANRDALDRIETLYGSGAKADAPRKPPAGGSGAYDNDKERRYQAWKQQQGQR